MEPSEELEALKAFLADEEGGMDCWGDEKIYTPLGTFVHVKRVVGSKHRWQTEMEEIYKSPSGAFFSFPWMRGNTESQDHDYLPDDIHEVEPHEVTIVEYRTKK